MKIYLTTTNPISLDMLVFEGITIHPHTLLSFYYKNLQARYEKIWDCPNNESIMIDSGAFSAWSLNKKINLYEYAEWAKIIYKKYKQKNNEIHFINLDVIPGLRGITSTIAERKDAIIQSKKNAKLLKNEGLPIVEVFHQDEDIEIFYDMVNRNYPNLIAISPRNDVPVTSRQTWLQHLLCKIIQKYGKNNIPKCHGLGVTAETMLLTFPFYSVDSSSWITPYVYGNGRLIGKSKLPRYKESQTAFDINIALMRAAVLKNQNQDKKVTE